MFPIKQRGLAQQGRTPIKDRISHGTSPDNPMTNHEHDKRQSKQKQRQVGNSKRKADIFQQLWKDKNEGCVDNEQKKG